MTRPGVEITSLAQAPPHSAPTDTGPAFMVAKCTNAGVFTVRSMAEYESKCGLRAGGVDGYDAADVFFREGGTVLTVSQLAAAGAAADVQAALDKLTKDMGPGQVFLADAAAGVVAGNHSKVLAHAALNNRIGLVRPADGTSASIISAATALQADVNARYGAMFIPSAIVPGIAGGTARTVPYTAVEAGLIARADLALTPDDPAAGDHGICQFAYDLVSRYTDQEYQDMNNAGADAARVKYGQVTTYGYRTLVNPTGPDAQWLDLSNARLNMAIVAEADVVGEHYVFSKIDGRGKTIAAFGGDLRAMLVPYYEAGSLYGDTPDEAFRVNVGSQVNTPTTIANGELHAVIELRMSPFAEWVKIEIVKVAPNVALAA